MTDMMSFKFKFPKLTYDDKKLTQFKMKEMKKISLPKNKNVVRVGEVARGPNEKFAKLLNNKRRAVRKPVSGHGLKRVRQQKGLNPWGDFDGDKVINMLDCDPRNKFKQGPGHELEDKLNGDDNGKKFIVDVKGKDIVPSENLRSNFQGTSSTSSSNPSSNSIDDKFNEVRPQAAAPQSNVVREAERKGRFAEFRERRSDLQEERRLRDDGILKDRQQRQAIIQQKAKEKAQKDFEKKRVRELAKVIQAKEDTRLTGREKRIQKIGKGINLLDRGISSASATITGGATMVGGFGVSQQNLAPVRGQLTRQQRILQALGKLPPEQAQQAQAQQSCGDAVRDVQRDPGQGVFSPNSKRVVRYVRGKYKK